MFLRYARMLLIILVLVTTNIETKMLKIIQLY